MNDLIERLTIMWRTGEFDHRTVGDAIDRIEHLEKVMRSILAVDPDFGHGSAIVRNIQKTVLAELPEYRE